MSRGLGDVYKRQEPAPRVGLGDDLVVPCLLYTSDAADDSLRVDLGGRRIIKKLYNLTLPTTPYV
ncbi:hypothetical protein JMUB7526_28690 [Staphylococcus aureus]